MLWAIDVGNTHTVVGLHDGSWRHLWRLDTHHYSTEDELAVALRGLCSLAGAEFRADGVVVASVVPRLDTVLGAFCSQWLGCEAYFVRTGEQVGLKVDYSPPNAVGADRIANALGALARFSPPLIVVDFGTATTFDTLDSKGTYVGGAIMPGPEVSAASLASRTAKLPSVALEAPSSAIGKSVVGSLQSGLVLGYADAVDGLARRIRAELGGSAKIVATGGLGALFAELCSEIEEYDPHLTLDGLRIAFERSGR
jgi:type III pantothenate kinase